MGALHNCMEGLGGLLDRKACGHLGVFGGGSSSTAGAPEATAAGHGSVEAGVPSPPQPPDNAPPLSRKQQKKQVLRDARQGRKDQKKMQKQADALGTMLASLGPALAELVGEEQTSLDALDGAVMAERIRTVFGVEHGYRQLPTVHGPHLREGLAAFGSTLVRPPKYNAKFLPQEYSLLHKLWVLLEGDMDGAGIVDIGAGNANCAMLAAALLGLTVFCVERESPRVELRGEVLLPDHLRQQVVRIESDIADFTATMMRDVAAKHGVRRVAIVAKHPCGIGVDRSIDFASQLYTDARQCEGAPDIKGVVIATCCSNKICQDDVKVSRVAEFCALNAKQFVGEPPTAALHRVVELMSRCSAWRTACGSEGNAIGPEQVEWAELFEDALQSPRLRRLGQIFGSAAQVRFAPNSCTLQDRCLLAASTPLPVASWPGGGRGEEDGTQRSGPLAAAGETSCNGSAFVAQVKRAAEALVESNGPIDCRPKGLKSARYGFDYTADPPPPAD